MITATEQLNQATATEPRPLRALVRDGLPLLVIATALDFSFALFVMVIQAFLPDTIGGSDRTPGLALGLYGATRVVLQLPGGLLARRIGAARLAVLGAGLATLATLLLSVATNVPQVYLLTLLAGSGTALVWPAVYLLAGDETADQRGALLSLLTFCALAGMGAGIILGALLVDTVPTRAIIPLLAIVLASAAIGGVIAGRRIEAKQVLQRSSSRAWERGRLARPVIAVTRH
ncbi:MAG: MFS transporter, partial [Dehalococcoidia bacterium]